MRINAGIYKGKRIIAPKKLPVRPTTDFAKEALFNILNNRVDFSSIRVLDLFAGTGNISYEFASRGASDITSVDAHYGCVQFIKKVADEIDMSIVTVKSDVFKFLSRKSRCFDLIFADPPYDFDSSQFETLVSLSFDNEFISDEGLLVIEHSKHTDLSALPHFQEARRYGGSVFSFFGARGSIK